MPRIFHIESLCSFIYFAVLSLGLCSNASAYTFSTPKNLQDGWDGDVQFGALATFGKADTSAVQARTDFTYRGESWEHEFNFKLYRSTTELRIPRRDENGDELSDANGLKLTDLIRITNNNRRTASAQPRWFFTSRHYVFAIIDLEVNEPIDVKFSSRQITGVGYKLWNNRKDFVSAAVGVGRKKLEHLSGETEEGAIGYLGFRLNRGVGEDMSLGLSLDSEFGGENRYSEIEIALGWKLRDPVAIKFKYDVRFNSTIVNLANTFDKDLEAALSVIFEVEVF